MKNFGLLIKWNNVNDLYRDVLTRVLNQGHEVSPRDKLTKELNAVTMVLSDASRCVVTIPERRLNYQFMVAEWLWMALGRHDARLLVFFNKNMQQFSDNDVDFYGAYGPWIITQRDHVISSLSADNHSRQAVLTVWRQNPIPSRDIPCTISMEYLIRDGKLHACVTMRSSDAWLGLPYDIFNFSRILAMFAGELKVGIGSLAIHTGSLHLYESDWEKGRLGLSNGMDVMPEPELPGWVPSSVNNIIDQIVGKTFYGFLETPTVWDEYLDFIRKSDDDGDPIGRNAKWTDFRGGIR